MKKLQIFGAGKKRLPYLFVGAWSNYGCRFVFRHGDASSLCFKSRNPSSVPTRISLSQNEVNIEGPILHVFSAGRVQGQWEVMFFRAHTTCRTKKTKNGLPFWFQFFFSLPRLKCMKLSAAFHALLLSYALPSQIWFRRRRNSSHCVNRENFILKNTCWN